jgi:hypothetical protein
LTLEDGTDNCPETSVRNYHYSLRISQKSAVLVYIAAEAWNLANCTVACYFKRMWKLLSIFEQRMQIVAVHKQSHVEDIAPNREEVTGRMK